MARRVGGARNGDRAGFTLIETLAALAVAAMIIVGATTLVHQVALSFDRGMRGVSDGERFALAMARLASDFGATSFATEEDDADGGGASRNGSPARAEKDSESKAPRVAFEGRPTKIVFVSASAAGSQAAPEEALTLSVEPLRDGGARLVRRRAIWLGSHAGLFARAAKDPVVLLEGRYDMAFRFARLDSQDALTWSDKWVGEIELPRVVRLTLRDAATGASLVASADFVVRTDAPPACARGASDCLPGAKVEPEANAPGSGAREPT